MGGEALTRIGDALAGVSALGLDTSPFIYFMEWHPVHGPVAEEVFRRIDSGSLQGCTSVVTLTEVLVKPKQLGQHNLEQSYRNFLLRSRHLTLAPIDTVLAERAADLRARYSVRTPDAFQLAAALVAGCQAFLTNDGGLCRVQDLQVLVLNELEA